MKTFQLLNIQMEPNLGINMVSFIEMVICLLLKIRQELNIGIRMIYVIGMAICLRLNGQMDLKSGMRHRDGDLPAIERGDGTKEWWVNGKRC